MRVAARLVGLLSCGVLGACMNAPHDAGEASFDAGALASELGVDAGPRKPPLGHLPEGSSCPAGGDEASGPAQRGANDDAGELAELPPPVAGEDADAAVALPRPAHAGALQISELLADPKTLDDATGEWLELHNPGTTTFDLQGCELFDRSVTPHAISKHVAVAPGRYLTIARTAAAGFPADLTLSFSLTNSAGLIGLRCMGVEIDRVAYDRAAGFPLVSGASAARDASGAWCLASASYGPELGTPGTANTACEAADAGANTP